MVSGPGVGCHVGVGGGGGAERVGSKGVTIAPARYNGPRWPSWLPENASLDFRSLSKAPDVIIVCI